MKLARVLAFLLLSSQAISPQAQAPSVLALSQSVQLPQASIWGGISCNGGSISITTTLFQNRPHLFLRKLDRELRASGDPVQLTFDSDPQATKRITDHKHLFLGGFHYVVFSVAGDSDLYIFRTDRDGHRVGSIVPVEENTPDRTMAFRINGYGQMMANGLAVDGGYRFFCFGNDRSGGITSFFTADGIAWTPEAGFRLAVDPDTKLESGQPTDPAVARLPDGSYLMVYTCRIPN